jgi:hypothetical protein
MSADLSAEAQCLSFDFPMRAPEAGELLAKPSQVKEYPNLMKDIHERLTCIGGQEKLNRPVKADGHSILIYCKRRNTLCRIVHRTKTGNVLFHKLDLKAYLSHAAFELSAIFKAELVAYYKGVEMGYLEVESMVALFKQNGYTNLGDFRLEIRIFGVYSIRVPGEMTERSGLELNGRAYSRVMSALVLETEDRFVNVIQGDAFRVSLGKDKELHFYREDEKTACAKGAQEFFDLCIREADALGIEGFVLVSNLERENTFDKHGDKLMRLGFAVKVKREYQANLVACRVGEAWSDKTEVWLFGRDRTGLVYAGKTDNERIASYLKDRTCAFEIEDPKTKETLYRHDPRVFMTMSRCFQALQLQCTNFSKSHYHAIGVKYNMKKVECLQFTWLSDTERVARSNPHFVKTKEASDAFAKVIRRGTKTPLIRPVRKDASDSEKEEDAQCKPVKRADTSPQEEPAPKCAKIEAPRVALDLQRLGPAVKPDNKPMPTPTEIVRPGDRFFQKLGLQRPGPAVMPDMPVETPTPAEIVRPGDRFFKKLGLPPPPPLF